MVAAAEMIDCHLESSDLHRCLEVARKGMWTELWLVQHVVEWLLSVLKLLRQHWFEVNRIRLLYHLHYYFHREAAIGSKMQGRPERWLASELQSIADLDLVQRLLLRLV